MCTPRQRRSSIARATQRDCEARAVSVAAPGGGTVESRQSLYHRQVREPSKGLAAAGEQPDVEVLVVDPVGRPLLAVRVRLGWLEGIHAASRAIAGVRATFARRGRRENP